MSDPQLNNLLKWSIENSSNTTATNDGTSDTADGNDQSSTTTTTQQSTSRPIDPALLNALFGGPSDADLMKESMTAIQSPNIALSEKLIAFDNFEQLIESLDNANNMASLELWTPLISLLEHEEAEMRKMAAWCVGTAVQNNVQAQERALVGGVVPKLIKMFGQGEEEANRRKARYAVSSLVRNYQPGLDAVLEAVGKENIDAGDMEGIDRLLDDLMKR